MVDGLSARLVHTYLQARHAGAVRGHDPHLPCSWRRGYRWFVEIMKELILRRLANVFSRYNLEPHD